MTIRDTIARLLRRRRSYTATIGETAAPEVLELRLTDQDGALIGVGELRAWGPGAEDVARTLLLEAGLDPAATARHVVDLPERPDQRTPARWAATIEFEEIDVTTRNDARERPPSHRPGPLVLPRGL